MTTKPEELARLATAVIEADAAVERYAATPHARLLDDTASGLRLVAYNARQALSSACSPAVILQLVALASGGAEAGDEFHTYTLLLDKYLDSYRGAIEAESDAGLHAPSDPDTDRAYERASIRRAKLDAYVAQRIRALTPERPADASQPGGAS